MLFSRHKTTAHTHTKTMEKRENFSRRMKRKKPAAKHKKKLILQAKKIAEYVSRMKRETWQNSAERRKVRAKRIRTAPNLGFHGKIQKEGRHTENWIEEEPYLDWTSWWRPPEKRQSAAASRRRKRRRRRWRRKERKNPSEEEKHIMKWKEQTNTLAIIINFTKYPSPSFLYFETIPLRLRFSFFFQVCC